MSKVDNTNRPCNNCDKGFYSESSVMDDINGVLHCTVCMKRVARWIEVETPKKENVMNQISITRALVELKRYDSRISTAISGGRFSAIQVGKDANASILGTNAGVDAVKAEINASFQKVESLISNRSKIKAAIVKSNAETMITFRGESMSVAAAIELKSTIATRELYLRTMRSQLANAVDQVEAGNANMRREIDALISAAGSGDKAKVSKEQIEMLEKLQESKKHRSVVSDELTRKKIEELEAEINDIKMELDYILTETNSKSMIEVEV